MAAELVAFVAGLATGITAALVPILVHVHALKDRLADRIRALEDGRIRVLEDQLLLLMPLAERLHADLRPTAKRTYRRKTHSSGRPAHDA